MRSAFLFLSFLFLCHPVSALEVCPFHGDINFLQKKLNIVLEKDDRRFVSAEFVFLAQDNLLFRLNLEHLQNSLFEISTQLDGTVKLSESPDQKGSILRGQIASQYSLINYKPVSEFSGAFEIKDGKLSLSDLSMGGARLDGVWDLNFPFPLDLSLQLNEIPLKNLIAVWLDDPEIEARGGVSGQLQISGVLPSPSIQGRLVTYEGLAGDLRYKSIVLNVEGQYPFIKLMNSVVIPEEGMPFNITGRIDLSNRNHFKKEIEFLTKSAVVNVGISEWAWTLKQNLREEDLSSEFKYFSRKKESQDNPLKEESDLLGVEQKIKF